MAMLGKGVEYALHCLVYFVDEDDAAIHTVSDLARFQGVSETYLAKIFTKLSKAGLIRSSRGAKGGYELVRRPEDISFWDVVVAVEGEPRLFECRNIREGCLLYQDQADKPKWLTSGLCAIHQVMLDAESKIKMTLREKDLLWLSQEVKRKVPKGEMKKFREWFYQVAESRK